MKRTLSLLVAVAAVLALGAFAPSAYAAVTKPAYAAPGKASVAVAHEDHIEVKFAPAPYADFYKIKYSTKSDMSNASYEWSQEIQDTTLDMWGLEEGKTYYVQVAVMNYATDRLSPYSTKVAVKTKPAGSGTWSG